MKLLQRRARVAVAALAMAPSILFGGPAARDAGATATQLDPAAVVAGIHQLVSGGAPGPVFAIGPGVVPVISGDEDTPVPSTFLLVAPCGPGRVMAMGHDGLITNSDLGRLDNRRFARQAFEWLDPSHRHRLGVTSGSRL